MPQTATNRGTFLGCPDFTKVYNSTDSEYGSVPLGTKSLGSDGHEHMYVQASAGVTAANPVAVIVTEPGMTIAAGAGAWNYNGSANLTTGQRCWVQKILI
jgi:hypothetical protein